MSKCQKFVSSIARVETGPKQFGGDWPGVFIRGDDALCFAASIRRLLKSKELDEAFIMENADCLGSLNELSELLRSCAVKRQTTA